MDIVLSVLHSTGILSPGTDTYTYNGNPSFSTIGKPHLDYYGGVTRQTSDEDILCLTIDSLRSDFHLALVTFFQKRDCRGGAGERKPFILSMTKIPQELRRVLYHIIPEYGYWDDLNKIATVIEEDRKIIAEIFAKQLLTNMKAFDVDSRNPIKAGVDRNLEKWLPTERQSDDKKWKAVQAIINQFNSLSNNRIYLRRSAISAVLAGVRKRAEKIDPDVSICYSGDSLSISCDKDGSMTRKYSHILKKAYALPRSIDKLNRVGYRKWCSFARSFYEIIEHFKSTDDWDLINYSAVPSIAFDRTKKQFEKHDHERFNEFIKSVKKGEAKINIGRLMPFELVRQPSSEVRDEQWRLIVEETRKFYSSVDQENIFHPANSIHVADVSGSMTMGLNPRPIDVSLSLAFLMSEVGQRPMYTFSGKPCRYEPSWKNLTAAQEMVQDPNYNTDLRELIDRIYGDCMEAADRDNVPPSDKIPSSIFIYTDGGFDFMCDMSPISAIDYIQSKFNRFKKIPTIVFWNVAGNTKDFAVTSNHKGCIQLAGFSKDLYTTFMHLTSIDEINPEAFFRKAVLSERYLPILILYDEWRAKNPDVDLSILEKSDD